VGYIKCFNNATLQCCKVALLNKYQQIIILLAQLPHNIKYSHNGSDSWKKRFTNDQLFPHSRENVCDFNNLGTEK